MADLPSEVITEILSRIPVKPLLRLRCTCKLWRSLIDSTDFIFFHLTKSKDSNIILRQHSRLYELDLNSMDRVKELNHPLMCYSNRIKILGSCNGLLCICNIADDIAFWNPSIRKHRIIPSAPLIRKDKNSDENTNANSNAAVTTLLAARVYGFGYDSFSDDYKLVSISYFVDLHNRSFDSQVRVYTMRTDVWKNVPSMPYALCCGRTMGVFVSGSIHWVVTRNVEPDQSDLIVAFDLRFEIFREIELPTTVDGKFEMEVAVFGGLLCVIENRGSEGFNVWVMREYGSGDSWCKLFTVEQPRDVKLIKCLKPLGYSRDGDKVLFEQDRGKLCWYNLQSKELSWVRISGMSKSVEGVVCVGSLVPPNLMNRSVHSKIQKLGEEKKNKKKRDDFLSKGFKLTL
ncbi:F-box protein CPR1 isoform X2 [Cicer arietinum]|uniref:F-box protein CPR1 isoform X2 n=1 Tax=Cicer arietinum TaxID=3827 RepID=A0A1S2YNU6_CICAR|nr:F-box protein CPR1 isoform X2 [Cicer arietinum]XP_027192598.1 F-box protein CPR1 isoform X2 [Cicer arietinum]